MYNKMKKKTNIKQLQRIITEQQAPDFGHAQTYTYIQTVAGLNIRRESQLLKTIKHLRLNYQLVHIQQPMD